MGLLLRFLVAELCLCCFILMEIFNKAPLTKPCQMNSRVVHLPPQRGWPLPPLPYPFLQTVPPSAPLLGEWTAPPPIKVPEPETPRAMQGPCSALHSPSFGQQSCWCLLNPYGISPFTSHSNCPHSPTMFLPSQAPSSLLLPEGWVFLKY